MTRMSTRSFVGAKRAGTRIQSTLEVAHQPRLLKRLFATFRLFPQSEKIDPETLELMRLRVAAVHGCAYCSTVRTWDVKEVVELKEDEFFETMGLSALTRSEELAVQVADYMSKDPQKVPDSFAEVDTGFTTGSMNCTRCRRSREYVSAGLSQIQVVNCFFKIHVCEDS